MYLVEKPSQASRFLFNPALDCPGNLVEGLNLYPDLAPAEFVGPDPGDLPVSHDHRRDPALISIHTFEVRRGDQMGFVGMGRQKWVKAGQ